MSFVLAHSLVGDPTAPKLALLLHGALGSGSNLRSLATKLSKRRPEYRFCLADLRHHGESQGAPPPNTLDSCARDLDALAQHLGQAPEVIAGHSFGGKTALMFSSLFPGRAKQIWVLDSNPGSQAPTTDNEILRVMQMIRMTTVPAVDRQQVVAELMAQGMSSGTANWVATNLQRGPNGFVWRFNLDAIRELVEDYFRVDLWPVLEDPTADSDFRIVVAERSDRWAPENRARIEQVAANTAVKLHVVPNAGHWLHVDNPDFLLQLMAENLY